ncbi:MAG TPA: transglutaminase domain-containing protein [Gaiellaceae bacterium]|nr:transglutaminase domain-containing protein [Gaiellaceae bacterium]
MARKSAACLLPAVVICAAWLRIEDPRLAGEALAVAALALVPALLPRWRLRAPALAGAAAGALWLSFGAQPWELLPFRDEHVLQPTLESLGLGAGDFYGVVLPFDPLRNPEMHSVLLLAIFGFVALVALLVASERPFSAAAVTVAAIGWPATLLDAGAAALGAVALAAVLWIFLVLRARTVSTVAVGALASVLVIASATWVSTATTFTQQAALEWEKWDFRGLPAKALGVRFVWDANYDGISFPPTKTVVLEIEGPERAGYWRASTLDLFTADRWIEELFPRLIADAHRAVPLDRLAPPRARNRSNWVEQRVKVKALVDDRVVAAGTPVALDGPSLGTVFYLSGGVVRARRSLDAGTRYHVWSYVPDPSPAALAAAPARYPEETRRFLTIWGQLLSPFGEVGRDSRMEELLGDPQYAAFGAYRPLYDEARRITADAENPYTAVLAIESWFRREGGFRYDEQPPRSLDLPPLVHFVTVTKAGYCQHYAGAMAVMLRLLGIPSRVAVGFTSGIYGGGAWKVTDHDAHAWVEAWFPNHGWVPFDPTPGRGTFAGIYSFASENAQAVAALGRGELARQASVTDRRQRDGASVPIDVGIANEQAPSLIGVALAVGALWALGVGVGKAGVRRARYLTRDPRRVATASRRELEAFLRDQGVFVAPSATLGSLQHAVQQELGLDGRSFAAAAARARFGPPVDAEQGARAAQRELRALLKRIRGELSPWARFRGFVSLRSLRGGWQG